MATMAAGDVGIGRGNGVEVAAASGDSARSSMTQPRKHEHLLRQQEHARQLIQLRARQRQLARKRFFAVVNASEWDDLIEDDEEDEDDGAPSPGASSSHGESSPVASNLAVPSGTATITRPPIISSKSFPPPRPSVVDGEIRIATDFHENFMNRDTAADTPFNKSTYPSSEPFATPIVPPFPPLTNSSDSPSSSDSEDLPNNLRSRFSVSTIATATPTTSPVNNRNSVRKSGLSFRLASLSGRASRALRRGTVSGTAPPPMADPEKAVAAAKRRSAKTRKDGRNSFFALAHTFSTRDSRRQHPPSPSPIPVLPPLPSATSFTFSSLSGISGPSSERRSPSLHLIPGEIPSVAPSLPPVDRFARLDGDDDTIGYAYAHHYTSSIDSKQSMKQQRSIALRSKSSQHYPRLSQDSDASKLSKPSQAPTPALLPGSLSGRASLSGESCLNTPDLSHSLPLAPPMPHPAHRRSAAQMKIPPGSGIGAAGHSRKPSVGLEKSSPSPRFGEFSGASGSAPASSSKAQKSTLLDVPSEVGNTATEGMYTPISAPSSALGLDLGLGNDSYMDSERQTRSLDKKMSVQSFNSLGTDYRIRPSDLGLLDDSGSEYEYEDYEPAPSTRPHSVVSTRRRRRRTGMSEAAFRPSLLISPSSPVSFKRQRSKKGRKLHTPSPSLSHRLSSFYGLNVPPPLPTATSSTQPSPSLRSSALTYASGLTSHGGRSMYGALSGVDPASALLSPPDTPWQMSATLRKERASRASIQTFGSSVLTYGSRASYLLGAPPQCVEEVVYLDEDFRSSRPKASRSEGDVPSEPEEEKGIEALSSPDRSDVPPRPGNPLPWAPRPSSIINSRRRANTIACHNTRDSTSSAGSASRPLPPIPTGTIFTKASEAPAPRKECKPKNTRKPRPLPNPPVGGDAVPPMPEPPHSAGLLSPPDTASSSNSTSSRPRRSATSAGFTTSTPKGVAAILPPTTAAAPAISLAKSELSPPPPVSASSSPKLTIRPLSRSVTVSGIQTPLGTGTLGGGTGAMTVPDIETLVSMLDEAERKTRSRPSSRADRLSSGGGVDAERRQEVLREVRAQLRLSRKSSVRGEEGKLRSASGSRRNSPALKPSALADASPALASTPSPIPSTPPPRPARLPPPAHLLPPASITKSPTPVEQDSLQVPSGITLEQLRASMLLSPAGTDYDDGCSSVGGTLINGTLINGFPLPPGLAHISLTPPAPLVPDSVKAESRTNSITPPPLTITKSRTPSLSSSIVLNKLEESSSEGNCSGSKETSSENEQDEQGSKEGPSVPPYPTLPVMGAVTSSPPRIRTKRRHPAPNRPIDVHAANSLGLRERALFSSASRLTFDRMNGPDATKAESEYDNNVLVHPPSPTLSSSPPKYQEALAGGAPLVAEVDDTPGSPFVAPLRLSKVLSTKGVPLASSAPQPPQSAGLSSSIVPERQRSSSLSTASIPLLKHTRSDSCSSTFTTKSTLLTPTTFEAPKVAPLRLSRVSRAVSMLRSMTVPEDEKEPVKDNAEKSARPTEAVTSSERPSVEPFPTLPPYPGSAPPAVPAPTDSSLFARQDDGPGNNDAIIEPSIATVLASMSTSGDRETIWSSRDTYANTANVTLGDGTGYDDVGCSSMNTLASSINTEHQHTILGFGFGLPSETPVSVPFPRQVSAERKKSVTSRPRSARNSMGSKAVTRTKKNLLADEELLRSLPDPSTFPIPYPITGSGSTPPSAYGRLKASASAESGVLTFTRSTPLPQLTLITDFSKPIASSTSNGPIPIQNPSRAPQPSSAVSTMSNFNFSSALRPGHARKGSSAASIRSVSSSIAVGPGKRRMNRQTLTDPRSPMPSAQVAAATLVARVKQKREAISKKKRAAAKQAAPPSAFQNAVKRSQKKGGPVGAPGPAGAVGWHYLDRENVEPLPMLDNGLKGKARLGGSGFFGSTVRAYPDPVNRPTQRPQRPFVKIPTNPMFTSLNNIPSKGIPVSKYYFKNNAVLRV